jgi:hypothetical protein
MQEEPTAYELLAQLAAALDAATDQARPHMTVARVTSLQAALDAAAHGGPNAAVEVINIVAKLAAGWRRADQAKAGGGLPRYGPYWQ